MAIDNDKKFNKSHLIVVATSIIGFFSGLAFRNKNFDKVTGASENVISKDLIGKANNKTDTNIDNKLEATLPKRKEDYEIGNTSSKKLAHPQEEPDKRSRFRNLVKKQIDEKKTNGIKQKKQTPADSFYGRLKFTHKKYYKYNLK